MRPTGMRTTSRPSGRPGLLTGSGGVEPVTAAPDGLEERGLAFPIQLVAQVADVDLDDVRLTFEVVVPDGGEDLLARKKGALMPREVLQQRELATGEVDRPPAAPDAMRHQVDAQVAELHRQRRALVGPASDRTNARQQLLEDERLGH